MKHILPKLIVAMDLNSASESIQLAHVLDPKKCMIKVGSSLFLKEGPYIIQALKNLNYEIFLDLKFHDIPHQVSLSCKMAAELGVAMLTLHCTGGENMLLAAKNAFDNIEHKQPLLFGVSILTSYSETAYNALGYRRAFQEQLDYYAQLATETKLDGLVCSPQELTILKEKYGKTLQFLCPGIRLNSLANDDQSRTLTPHEAVKSGADFIVVGRPITTANSPKEALELIYSQMQT